MKLNSIQDIPETTITETKIEKIIADVILGKKGSSNDKTETQDNSRNVITFQHANNNNQNKE